MTDNVSEKDLELVVKVAEETINRQKAEIERLEKENVTFAKRFYKEGVKEFAERLKEKTFFVTSHLGNISVLAMHKLINNLVKEMTEGGVDNA